MCNGLALPFLADAGAERKFFVLFVSTWSVSPLNTAQEQERIKNVNLKYLIAKINEKRRNESPFAKQQPNIKRDGIRGPAAAHRRWLSNTAFYRLPDRIASSSLEKPRSEASFAVIHAFRNRSEVQRDFRSEA